MIIFFIRTNFCKIEQARYQFNQGYIYNSFITTWS